MSGTKIFSKISPFVLLFDYIYLCKSQMVQDKMFLKDVATIRTGVVLARKRANSDEIEQMEDLEGEAPEYLALNLKSVSDSGEIDPSKVEYLCTKEHLSDVFLTHEDDILIRLSAPYTTMLITGEHTNLLVPSHFAIIRVIPEEADAAFVFHFLQDKSTKQQILQNANGSSFLGTINSGFFATIQIPDVPLEKQKIIGNMVRQAKLEQFLLKHLAEKKLKLRQLTIEAAYKKFKK
ncbi:restriction endonuclease subunit S [Fibrobacter sp. UWH9]|uniref:restriction endonuclease subunit S n=1 Tax=Fibrobacter sp. UWH9 TaxID=1896213 RepID=UPI0009FA5094|nr:restriction endonuclease subunit S [Fibrobacter sp. UWH9]